MINQCSGRGIEGRQEGWEWLTLPAAVRALAHLPPSQLALLPLLPGGGGCRGGHCVVRRGCAFQAGGGACCGDWLRAGATKRSGGGGSSVDRPKMRVAPSMLRQPRRTLWIGVDMPQRLSPVQEGRDGSDGSDGRREKKQRKASSRCLLPSALVASLLLANPFPAGRRNGQSADETRTNTAPSGSASTAGSLQVAAVDGRAAAEEALDLLAPRNH